MSCQWKKRSGAAIIIHTYIANGPHQMTVISGDFINVIESTDTGWLRGKNIHTQRQGIFPLSCAEFIADGDPDDISTYLTSSSDLLQFEAVVTVRYALLNMSKKKPEAYLNISNRISDVVQQLDLIPLQKGQPAVSTHATLGTNIDNLRESLDLKRNSRSLYSTMTTLSTWGRAPNISMTNIPLFNGSQSCINFKNIFKSTDSIDVPTDYVIIHASVEPISINKPMVARFYLFNAKKKSYLSLPLSLLVPKDGGNKINLVFHQLDKGFLMGQKIYLIIYTFDLTQHDDKPDVRKAIGCAVLNLEGLDSYGNSTVVEVQSTTSNNKSLLPTLHEILTSESENNHRTEKSLNRCIPYFSVRVTPFYGTTDDVVKGQNLQDCHIIPPLLLPSYVDKNEIISMLTVCFNNLALDVHHTKVRISIRLLDMKEGCFVNGIESVTSPEHKRDVWYSYCYKGKDIGFNDTFSIDLTTSNSPLSNLFLLIQIEKSGFPDTKLVPNCFGVLPLASEIGSFTLKTTGSLSLYLYPEKVKAILPNQKDHDILHPKTKHVGSLQYRLDLASTVITQDQPLFKLLHYQEYKEDVADSVNNFMFCGINEWSKYSPNILLNLCSIISSMPQCAAAAFTSLQAMIGELTSRSGDYMKSLAEFVKQKFDPSNPSEFSSNLENLSVSMLPLIVGALDGEKDQNYRNLIKTLPFLLQLVSRDFAMKPSPEARDNMFKLFGKLNDIVKSSEGVNLINQRLLLQHFSTLVDDLPLCFDPKDASSIIYNFISSIRSDDDKLLIPKMQLLLTLSHKDMWHEDSTQKLSELFSTEINNSIPKPDCLPYINKILSSIMYSSNSNFIISFIPVFEKLIQLNDQNSTELVIAFAYNFPQSFPISTLITLINSPIIPNSQKLFIFNYVISINSDDIITKLRDQSDQKYRLFSIGLSIAIQSVHSMQSPLDSFLSFFIYNINNDFSVYHKIFASFPTAERLHPSLIESILECCILFPSKSLSILYFLIYSADVELNTEPTIVKQETLRSLWKLSEKTEKGRINRYGKNLDLLFRNNQHSEFSRAYCQVVKNIKTIRKCSVSVKDEDKLAEAIEGMIETAIDAHDNVMEKEMLTLIIDLNLKCKNNIEAAMSLSLILPLIPCTNERIDKFYDFKAICGRELHVEILFKIIELCIENQYDEYALKYVDDLLNTCVYPFQNVELMPKITHLQSIIYENISTKQRNPSSYFLLSFYGKFDSYFRNRSFIYRRDFYPGSHNKFKDDIKAKFAEARVEIVLPPNFDPIASQKEQLIVCKPLQPAYAEEVDDIFYEPFFKDPRYIEEFKKYDRNRIFRSEDIIADNSIICAADQSFFVLSGKKTFPTIRRRIEVDISNVKARHLDTITYTSVMIQRIQQKLRVELYWANYSIENSNHASGEACLVGLHKLVNSSIQAGSGKVKEFAKYFLTSEFIKKHPEEDEKVKKMRLILKYFYMVIENCVTLLVKTPHNKNSEGDNGNDLTWKLFSQMQTDISHFVNKTIISDMINEDKKK